MARFQIVPAKTYHCGRMVRRLRREHVEAMPPEARDHAHRLVREMFDGSVEARAVYLGQEIVGLFGLHATLASGKGFLWAAFSDECARFPLAFVRRARVELERLQETRVELETTIIEDDAKSKRLAEMLGFWNSGKFSHRPGQRLFVYSRKKDDIGSNTSTQH